MPLDSKRQSSAWLTLSRYWSQLISWLFRVFYLPTCQPHLCQQSSSQFSSHFSHIQPLTPFLHPVRYATKFRHEADILPLRYREDARSSKARGYNLTRISYQSFQFLHLPVRPIKAGGSVHKSRAVHFLTGSETCLHRLIILVTFAFNSRPLSPADTVVPVGAMPHKHTHT